MEALASVRIEEHAQGETAGTVARLSPTALRVRGLRKTYDDGAVEVFRDISFDVLEGQSVALIGANGTGKSTLLRCCLRLIEPDDGEVTINGRDLTRQSGRGLRKSRARVGFVFQKHNLVPRLSVLSNVCHGALARGHGIRAWGHAIAHKREREKALHCLELVGLADLVERRADHLSGGQSQRVAIARALMQEPELLFADEPVASLDPHAGAEIMELFARLNRDHGLTFVFVSHQLEHALHFAERILGLSGGNMAIDAPAHSHSLASLRGFYE
jgi:phosphonate transport system ATP-binding protein